MDYTVVIVLGVILIFGAAMFGLIGKLTIKNCRKQLDVEQYRIRCLANEQKLKREEVSSYHLTVLEADKLVDQALRECSFGGNNMGERMRSASSRFSDLNGLWAAHKLRNRIAHETNVSVSYDEARHALNNFRKALKDLGAI
jgi:hypothetical protein